MPLDMRTNRIRRKKELLIEIVARRPANSQKQIANQRED